MTEKVNWADTIPAYDAIIKEARELMIQKNHDYGDSWRKMRTISLTDKIRAKAERIANIEDLQMQGKQPLISEGIEAEYRDILNYCAFALIKIKEAQENE